GKPVRRAAGGGRRWSGDSSRHGCAGDPGDAMETSRASAADLKFLGDLPQARAGTSNRKAALEPDTCQCPLLPKFVSERAAMDHELRGQGTSGMMWKAAEIC